MLRQERTLSPSRMRDGTVVIGAGRVGSVFAARLGATAYGRGEEVPLGGVRLVCIATPDAAITEVCGALAPRLGGEVAVVHFAVICFDPHVLWVDCAQVNVRADL